MFVKRNFNKGHRTLRTTFGTISHGGVSEAMDLLLLISYRLKSSNEDGI